MVNGSEIFSVVPAAAKNCVLLARVIGRLIFCVPASTSTSAGPLLVCSVIEPDPASTYELALLSFSVPTVTAASLVTVRFAVMMVCKAAVAPMPLGMPTLQLAALFQSPDEFTPHAD